MLEDVLQQCKHSRSKGMNGSLMVGLCTRQSCRNILQVAWLDHSSRVSLALTHGARRNASTLLDFCRVASVHADSKLELPTQQLIELIFSDSMFQEAMQVSLTQHDLLFASS